MANCRKEETALKAQISRARTLITTHTVQDKFTSVLTKQSQSMANCKKDETALKAQISRILITRHTVQDKFTSVLTKQS